MLIKVKAGEYKHCMAKTTFILHWDHWNITIAIEYFHGALSEYYKDQYKKSWTEGNKQFMARAIFYIKFSPETLTTNE